MYYSSSVAEIPSRILKYKGFPVDVKNDLLILKSDGSHSTRESEDVLYDGQHGADFYQVLSGSFVGGMVVVRKTELFLFTIRKLIWESVMIWNG